MRMNWPGEKRSEPGWQYDQLCEFGVLSISVCHNNNKISETVFEKVVVALGLPFFFSLCNDSKESRSMPFSLLHH